MNRQDTVPPVWQCARDDCHREAIDPARGSALCEDHYTPSPLDARPDELAAEADAVARPQEPDADVVDPETYTIDEADATAAAFMGGDSMFANDDDPDPDPSPFTTGEASYARTVSALPLRQLDALSPDDRRRAARKQGVEWPSTDDARDQLFDTIATVMRHEDDRVVDAPTSLGKSHTIAATRWGARDDLTGDEPVVHLSATRKARDKAAEVARKEGGEHIVLLSRHEACAVAGDDHDPVDDDDTDEDHVAITIDGQPASEWIDDMCNNEGGKGLPFSAVHRHLEDHNDPSIDLPCREDGECEAIQQYTRWRDGDHPLVIATHNFAHIPGLRTGTNVVVDEEPDYRVDLERPEAIQDRRLAETVWDAIYY